MPLFSTGFGCSGCDTVVGFCSGSATLAGVTKNEFNANLGLGGNYDINKKWALTMHVSDLVSYESANGSSLLTVGFSGLNNPLATSKFGVVYKF